MNTYQPKRHISVSNERRLRKLGGFLSIAAFVIGGFFIVICFMFLFVYVLPIVLGS